MTIRSEHGALIRFATTDVSSDDALDTDLVRVMRNNLLHKLDSFGRVLVAWAGATLAQGVHVDPGPGATINAGTHLWTSPPLHVRLQPDGSTYPVRVALNGCETDPGGGAALFRIALTTTDLTSRWRADAQGDDPNALNPPGTPNCAGGSGSAGTGSIWVTLDKNVLVLPASRMRNDASVLRRIDTVNAIGGDRTTVDVACVRVTVWCTGTDLALFAVCAAEYCGGP